MLTLVTELVDQLHLLIIQRSWASAFSSTYPCRLQVDSGALVDKVALVFGQSTENVKDETVAPGGAVYSLLQALETNPPLPQCVNCFNEILQRSPKPLQSPDDQSVALAQRDRENWVAYYQP